MTKYLLAGLLFFNVCCLASHAQATMVAPGTLVAPEFAVVGTKWGAPVPGTPATVTWSLMPTGPSCAADGGGICQALSSFMPVGFLTPIQAAFDAWSAVAGITFVQVADNGAAFNGAGAVGDIRLAGHAFDGPSGILAHGYFPPPHNISAPGDVHFDIGDSWSIPLVGPGFSIFFVALHEIGHAIGLNHTTVPNSVMNATYTEALAGLQADDIAGAQFLYGQPIPEPATLSLLGIGLALLGLALRGRPVLLSVRNPL